jgi:hypothetical protein
MRSINKDGGHGKRGEHSRPVTAVSDSDDEHSA